MAPQLSEEEILKLARQRVEEKKGFFIHLIVYLIINTGLILIWAFASHRGYPWFLFPLCGWGIGLLFHGLGVFVFNRRSGWEHNETQKEIARIKREQGLE